MRRRLRRLDAWYFRLNDGQRIGVGVGALLLLFSSVLYCLGIGSIVLLQRVELAQAGAPAPPDELEDLTPDPTWTPFPTLSPSPTVTLPPGSPPPTPIAAPDIPEPPAIPRVVIPDPPVRPRFVATPEPASEPTAAPRTPNPATPAATRPTGQPTPRPPSKPGTTGTPNGVAPPTATRPAGPPPTQIPAGPTTPTSAVPQSTLNAIPKVPPAVTATPMSKPQTQASVTPTR